MERGTESRRSRDHPAIHRWIEPGHRLKESIHFLPGLRSQRRVRHVVLTPRSSVEVIDEIVQIDMDQSPGTRSAVQYLVGVGTRHISPHVMRAVLTYFFDRGKLLPRDQLIPAGFAQDEARLIAF